MNNHNCIMQWVGLRNWVEKERKEERKKERKKEKVKISFEVGVKTK